eukprot:TRINITY_DN4642_c0_g1_i2.p1 TRINITY_DN4642_c0_g1~~TRINITY_DN4642_c0_g1_i2.p1  ORF type:complete len:754 (+),score=231.52 TRINITY_DN4642_c0_g1_i2:121-2382(+)
MASPKPTSPRTGTVNGKNTLSKSTSKYLTAEAAAPVELDDKAKISAEKAIDGKLNSIEYKDHIVKYIKDVNDKTIANFQVVMNKTLLTDSVPVVDPLVDSTRWGTDTLDLTNNGKKTVYFQFRQKNSPKYDLQISPHTGKIKKGSTIQITFKFRAFCTSKFYQLIQIALSYSNLSLERKKTFLSFGRSTQDLSSPRPEPTLEEVNGTSLVFCLRIESELSSFLDYDEIEMGKKLAGGAFGTVYQAYWRDSEVAVKVLHNASELTEEERDNVKREIALMSKLSFPYIVTYMGSTAAIPTQPLSMVMEYIKGGSLTSLIKSGKTLSFKYKCKVSLDVAKGMAYLHSHNIYHRDLKPDNFLIISVHDDVDVNLKITDFGTSRSTKRSKEDLLKAYQIEETKAPAEVEAEAADAEKNKRCLTNGVGTLIYQAPETLDGRTDYDIGKTDLYSFGCSLLHIFSGVEPYSNPPFNDYGVWDIVNYVLAGKRLPIPGEIDLRIRKMITDCCLHNVDKRPKFVQLVKELQEIMTTEEQPFERPPQSTSQPTSPQILHNGSSNGTPTSPNVNGDPNSSSSSYPSFQNSPIVSTPSNDDINKPVLRPGMSSYMLNPGNRLSSGQVPAGVNLQPLSTSPQVGKAQGGKGTPVPNRPDLVCWSGTISRQESEAKLMSPGIVAGTFLTRWSDNTNSYVLTYKKVGGGIEHIAHIRPTEGEKIKVGKSDGTEVTYETLIHYIDTLREENVISAPLFEDQGQQLYMFTK